MNSNHSAAVATEQIALMFRAMFSAIISKESLCDDGMIFDDENSPEWKERYRFITTEYGKALDMFEVYLSDISELYKMKSHIELGILKDVTPRVKESA